MEVPSAGRVELSSVVPRRLDHRTAAQRTSNFHRQFDLTVKGRRHEPAVSPEDDWQAIAPDDPQRPRSEPGTAVLRLDLAYMQRPSEEDIALGLSAAAPPEAKDDGRHGPHRPRPFETFKEQIGEDLERLAEGQHRIWGEHRATQREIWSRSGKARAHALRGLDLLGESRCPVVRPWVDPPKVTVGDSPVRAIWGVNEYRFAAGTHLVEIAVPPPPEAVGRGAAVSLDGASRLLFELELPEGTMTTVEAIAEIAMTVDAEGTGLASYAGTIDAVFAPET